MHKAGGDMKKEIVKGSFGWIAVAVLFVAMAIPIQVAGQEANKGHHHYKLIDLGTLGGPTSVVAYLVQPLNNRGVVTSFADTPVLDPNFPNINPFFGSDRFIQHAFLWEDGELEDLGTLPNGTSSGTNWISDRGVVVGASTNGAIDPLTGLPEIRATVWKHGSVLDLGTLGGNESEAFAVNDRGEVVGGAMNTIADPYTSNYFNFFIQGATQVHAIRWYKGKMHDLGTLGGPDSVAFYVTRSGKIIGQSFTDSIANVTTGLPTVDPFLWDDGKMIDLGTLGGVFGAPNWFNERGQVVGTSDLLGDNTFHPFLWDEGKLLDLGTFGGDNGQGNWINETGEVVGEADFPGNQVHHAFLWRNGEKKDLGTVGNDGCSQALGINSRGQIIGTSTNCKGVVQHVFLWENGGPMVDLRSLLIQDPGIMLTELNFINDRGEIAGDGILPNGDKHGILLVPCDEDHRDIEGCDFEAVEEIATAGLNSAQIAQAPSAIVSEAGVPTSEMIEQIRTLRAKRIRQFRSWPQK
jgi:probable HAF family extracellular repeat protein